MQSVKLHEIAEITSGYAFKSADLSSDTSGYAIAKIANVINPTVDVEFADYFPRNKFTPRLQKYLVKNDDILVAMTGAGSVGRIGIVKSLTRDVLLNQRVGMVRANDERCDQTYLASVLTMPLYERTLYDLGVGAGQPNVSPTDIGNLLIPLPEMEVQKRIAAVLSAYDLMIQNNSRRLVLLESMAEEVFREWFVRHRFPHFKTNTFERGVPTGWAVQPLESICDEVRASVRKQDLDDDESYVGLEHIPRKSITLKGWSTADTIVSNKLRFQKRDILFGKIRPYLHKVVLTHIAGACSSDTIVIRPTATMFEGFLLFTVFSETFIDLATVASTGTKMPRADWDFLKRLELLIPPEDLLLQYQTFFESVFSQMEGLLNSNERLKSSRELLVSRLISGKLPVSGVDISFPQTEYRSDVELDAVEEPVHA